MSNNVLIKISADDRATPVLNSVQSSLRQIVNTGIGTALGTTLANAASAAANSLQSLIGDAFTTAASFERMEIAIGTLVRREMQNLGESLDTVGEKTQDLINWTRELAKLSPFDPAQVTDALRMALAFGFTTDEAKRLTQATLDYAAGAGLTTETMQQVAYALGQIKANSRVTGEEIMQLTNAGIAARDILAKSLGVSIEELNKLVSAGKVSAETAVEAILAALETDFGGAAARQANSLSGLLNTLTELKDTALVTTFRPLLESLKPLAELTITWLEDEGINKLKAFGESLAQVADKAVAFVVSIVQAENPVQTISNALSSISPDAGNIFLTVFGWVTDNKDAIVAALTGIAAALGGIAVVSGIAAAITALINPLTLLSVAAGALAVAWQQNWGDIQTKTQEAVAFIQTKLQNAITFTSEKWSEAWPEIQEVTQKTIETIKQIVQNGLNWFKTDGVTLLNNFKDIWQSTWDKIKSIVDFVTTQINTIIEAFQAAAEDDWRTFGSKLRDVVDAGFNKLVEIVSAIGEKLKELIASAISAIIEKFKSTDWGEVGRSISNGIASGVSQTAKNIANAAMEAASNAVEAVKGFLRIQSPSKVFEREIGMQISAGMAQGILKNIGAVESAATTVASRTVSLTTNISIDARNANLSRDDIEASVKRALQAQREDTRLRRLV